MTRRLGPAALAAALWLTPGTAHARGGYSTTRPKPSLPSDIRGELDADSNQAAALAKQAREIARALPQDPESGGESLKHYREKTLQLTEKIERLDAALSANSVRLREQESAAAASLAEQASALETAAQTLRTSAAAAYPGSTVRFWTASWRRRHRAAAAQRLAARLRSAAQRIAHP